MRGPLNEMDPQGQGSDNGSYRGVNVGFEIPVRFRMRRHKAVIPGLELLHWTWGAYCWLASAVLRMPAA